MIGSQWRHKLLSGRGVVTANPAKLLEASEQGVASLTGVDPDRSDAKGLASLTTPSWNQILQFVEQMRQLQQASSTAA